MTDQPSSTDAAWTAGFLDGEGHLGITMRSSDLSIILRIACDQVDPTPILKLKELFGGNVVLRNYPNRHSAPYYQWTLSGQSVDLLLDAIEPYVTVKKEHVRVAKAFRALIFEHKDKVGRTVKLTEDEIHARMLLYIEMQELNAKFKYKTMRLTNDGNDPGTDVL